MAKEIPPKKSSISEGMFLFFNNLILSTLDIHAFYPLQNILPTPM